jgi:hypothetical protein
MAQNSDYLKKQPSKNEKVFSEITMYLHDIDHRIWSVASQVLAMGLVQKVSPKDMAEMLTGNDSKLQEYAKQINEEIKKIEGDKAPAETHNHVHDHAQEAVAEIENVGDAESPEEISEIES